MKYLLSLIWISAAIGLAVLASLVHGAETPPDLGAPALHGEVTYAQAYAAAMNGQPLTINFGATWCGPCRALRAAMQRQPRPYVHIDIDRPEEPEVLKAFWPGGFVPQVWRFWPDSTSPTGWRKVRER